MLSNFTLNPLGPLGPGGPGGAWVRRKKHTKPKKGIRKKLYRITQYKMLKSTNNHKTALETSNYHNIKTQHNKKQFSINNKNKILV